MATTLHADEIASDEELVRRLLAEQRPEWAGRPVVRVRSTGTENALYRVGDDVVVRLPRRPAATGPIEEEQRWLPVLAPHLPLAVPEPLGAFEPTEAFPWVWSAFRWLDGRDAITEPLAPGHLAADLARFLRALRAVDPTDGPAPASSPMRRGVPLARRDVATRSSIALAADLVDSSRVTTAWDRCVATEPWDRPPTWIHGDLAAGNLLGHGGRLSAVIDWGSLGVGDPACDLIVAWELLDEPGRTALRRELEVDDATWERGRGWALSTAILALPYYQHTNPFMADQARRKLAAVLTS